MLVSILVPFYGVERYISKCARSLFAQSYPSCEFIFVDDNSRDRSLEELKVTIAEFPTLKDRIKVISHSENMGVASARNSAMDAATGDYILFVDSDDWVDPEIVSKLVKHAESTSADICNAWCKSVTESGEQEPMPTVWIGDNRSHFTALVEQSHIAQNHIRGVLFRRSLFEDNALRFTPQVDFGEDYSLLPQVVYHASTLSTLREYLYSYRIENEGSYMNNIGEKHLRSYIAANRIVERFIDSRPDAKRYQRAKMVGRINIKKWIFRRGFSPRDYNSLLFAEGERIKQPTLRLYNWVVDSENRGAIKLLSVAINLRVYLRSKLIARL